MWRNADINIVRSAINDSDLTSPLLSRSYLQNFWYMPEVVSSSNQFKLYLLK